MPPRCASPKVTVVHADAFTWLESAARCRGGLGCGGDRLSRSEQLLAVGKLYSTSFYQIVDQHLAAEAGGADHLAAGGAAQLLDGGGDAGDGRPDDDALPRAGAELRRVGLHRAPAAVAAPTALPRGCAS